MKLAEDQALSGLAEEGGSGVESMDGTPEDELDAPGEGVIRAFDALFLGNKDIVHVLSTQCGKVSLSSSMPLVMPPVRPSACIPLPDPFCPPPGASSYARVSAVASALSLTIKGNSTVADDILAKLRSSTWVAGNSNILALFGFVARKDSARRAALATLVSGMYRVYGALLILAVLFQSKSITKSTELYGMAEK